MILILCSSGLPIMCNIMFLLFQFLIEVKNSHKSSVPSDWVMVSRYVKYLWSLFCFNIEEKSRGILVLQLIGFRFVGGFFSWKPNQIVNLLLKSKKNPNKMEKNWFLATFVFTQYILRAQNYSPHLSRCMSWCQNYGLDSVVPVACMCRSFIQLWLLLFYSERLK